MIDVISLYCITSRWQSFEHHFLCLPNTFAQYCKYYYGGYYLHRTFLTIWNIVFQIKVILTGSPGVEQNVKLLGCGRVPHKACRSDHHHIHAVFSHNACCCWGDAHQDRHAGILQQPTLPWCILSRVGGHNDCCILVNLRTTTFKKIDYNCISIMLLRF